MATGDYYNAGHRDGQPAADLSYTTGYDAGYRDGVQDREDEPSPLAHRYNRAKALACLALEVDSPAGAFEIGAGAVYQELFLKALGDVQVEMALEAIRDNDTERLTQAEIAEQAVRDEREAIVSMIEPLMYSDNALTVDGSSCIEQAMCNDALQEVINGIRARGDLKSRSPLDGTYSMRMSAGVANDVILPEPLDNGGTVHNVKGYGATGDGVTNDAQAFGKAITAVRNGDKVYVPPGEYLLGEPRDARVHGVPTLTATGIEYMRKAAGVPTFDANGIATKQDTCVRCGAILSGGRVSVCVLCQPDNA